MALIEKLNLLISSDVDGAVKGLEKVGKAADRDLSKAEVKADKFSASMTKMGAASLAGAAVIATALASTLGEASDLNEAINVNSLTFGESEQAMLDWAETGAKAFGQSKRQALENAAAIGGLLQNVGFLEKESADLSRQLVVLASDMGSAFNMDPSDALAALRSGLAGESEPLKRFNVFVNEAAVKAKALELGLGGATGALTDHEKAQARLAIIMEQTSKIQGDFAATSDGAANSSRVLKAELENAQASIGQAVLPIFQELLNVAVGVTDAFNSLSPETQALIGKALVLGTAALALVGTLSTVTGKAIQARDAFVKLRTDGLSKAGAAAGVFGVALVGVGLIMNERRKEAERLRSAIADIEAAMESSGSAAEGYRKYLEGIVEEGEFAGNALASLGADGVDVLADAMAQGATRDQLVAIIGDLGDVSATTAMILANDLSAQVDGYTAKVERSASITHDAADAQIDLAGELAFADAAARGSADAMGTATTATSRYADQTETAAEKVARLTDELDFAVGALDRFFGRVTESAELEANFEQAIDDAADAIVLHGTAMKADTEAGRSNIKARNDVVKAIQDQVEAMTEEGKSVDEIEAATAAMIERLREEAAERGVGKAAIDEYVAALGLTPADVRTALILAGYDENVAALAAYKLTLDGLPTTVQTELVTLYTERGARPVIGNDAGFNASVLDAVDRGLGNYGGGRANGGPVSAGVTYMVGERGPELLTMGSQGGFVTPNGGGGSSAPIHVHAELDGRELFTVVVDENNRRGRPLAVR